MVPLGVITCEELNILGPGSPKQSPLATSTWCSNGVPCVDCTCPLAGRVDHGGRAFSRRRVDLGCGAGRTFLPELEGWVGVGSVQKWCLPASLSLEIPKGFLYLVDAITLANAFPQHTV